MSYREFIKKIREAGWIYVRNSHGSHVIYQKRDKLFSVPNRPTVKKGIIWNWERMNAELDQQDVNNNVTSSS